MPFLKQHVHNISLRTDCQQRKDKQNNQNVYHNRLLLPQQTPRLANGDDCLFGTDTKKRGSLYCHSFRTQRLSHCPQKTERATQKPTPICIHSTTHLFEKGTMVAYVYDISTGHLPPLMLKASVRNLRDFCVPRTKRLVNAFPYRKPTHCPPASA